MSLVCGGYSFEEEEFAGGPVYSRVMKRLHDRSNTTPIGGGLLYNRIHWLNTLQPRLTEIRIANIAVRHWLQLIGVWCYLLTYTSMLQQVIVLV